MSATGFGTFSQAEVDEAQKPLPVGVYDVRIDAVDACVSKSSGNDMLKFTLTIIRDAKTGDESNAGKKIFDYLVAGSNYTLIKTSQIAKSIGLNLDGQVIDQNTFFGYNARISVKHEPYNGQPSAKLDAWVAQPGAKPERAVEVAPAGEEGEDNIPF